MFGVPGLSGMGLLEWLRPLISGKPERRKAVWPTCEGAGLCRQCDGRGYAECRNTGQCQTCDGLGVAA